MVIKLTTLMKTKFGINNPHEVIRELRKIGTIGSRSLRKPFEDTPLERFDIEVIKKYVEYVSSNSSDKAIQYKPEYWMYRCNISYEDSVNKVEEHKKNKSTSKENFIKRHGEEKGLEMFEKFQKTSAYSSSDDWFIETYGDGWESKKEYDMRRKSKRRVEYWTHRGYDEETAKLKVSEYQKSTSGLHRDYYRNLGYTEEEIDVIFSEIKKKQKNHHRNTNYLKEKYPDTWKEIYSEVSEKYRKRMEELGIWIEKDIIDDFKKYKSLVNRYTDKSLLFYGDLVENLELRSREFQLDHKYSMKMGFINDIPPEIIGSIVNLEILPAKLNNSKKEKCSITKKQLLQDYKNFKENYESKSNQI